MLDDRVVFPASGLASGSLNGLNPKSNSLAVKMLPRADFVHHLLGIGASGDSGALLTAAARD
jgi:hypothetical protein